MASGKAIQRKADVVTGHGRSGIMESHLTFDDSLLPAADELRKLKELDPDIMSWMKERTALEQSKRLEITAAKVDIVYRDQTFRYNIDRLVILSAFMVFVIGMAISYFLISNSQALTGSLFAGGTLLLTGSAFLKFKNNLVHPETKPTKN